MNGSRQEECPLNEQAVGWALHALEPGEELEVVLHLPQCPSCQEAVRDADEVMSGLGAAVEQVDPPPSLRANLMARVAETSQLTPGVPPRPRTSDETRPSPAHRSEPAPSRRPAERVHAPADPPERRSWLSRKGRTLVAAGLALIAVVTIGGLAARTVQLEQQRSTVAAQAGSLTDFVRRLDQPGTDYALLAEDGGPTVAAVLVADGERQVYPIGLPANASDRDTYVLWGIRAGADPRAIGTFDVAPTDQGLRTVGTAQESDNFTSYAISLEPGRTAPPAPSDVVASGALAT